jgi:rhamnosyltransferase
MEASTSSKNNLKNQNVCAVVITYNPDDPFPMLLRELDRQVAYIVVVDNASSGESLEYIEQVKEITNLTIIKNAENVGVAAGLNQGFMKSGELGFKWVIAFDQDSRPEPGMVRKLWKLLQEHSDTSMIGIVAPIIMDNESKRNSPFLRRKSHFIYERVECHQGQLADVTAVITTGSLVRLSTFEELGGFREDLFIDYVDTDFCLRLLLHGYQIWVACDAELHHTFGHRKKIRKGPFTFYPTFHPPERWYTISRNRIQMIKSYGFRFPHWLFYEFVATSYIFLRMLFTENDRLAKLLALIQGTRDGLRGRLGKPYWAIEKTNTKQ